MSNEHSQSARPGQGAWSKTLPTQEGWYFYREPDWSPEEFEIYRLVFWREGEALRLRDRDYLTTIEGMKGQWQGPLSPDAAPIDKEQAADEDVRAKCAVDGWEWLHPGGRKPHRGQVYLIWSESQESVITSYYDPERDCFWADEEARWWMPLPYPPDRLSK